jgi:hypothetical protein
MTIVATALSELEDWYFTATGVGKASFFAITISWQSSGPIVWQSAPPPLHLAFPQHGIQFRIDEVL